MLDLGLENRMTTKVGLLSGGQRQALTLLMATLQKPQLLLLDEHTAALDPKTAKKVLDLTKGSIIELDNKTTSPIKLLANGSEVAKGEVVIIEDNFGLRITEISEKESGENNEWR